MRRHVLEDRVESRTRIDGVRLRHIASRTRSSSRGGRPISGSRAFYIPVGENANERLTVEHRKMPDLVLDHQPPSTTQAVSDIDRVRKGGHHRRNRRDMVHADCGFKPDAGSKSAILRREGTLAGFKCSRFRSGAKSPAAVPQSCSRRMAMNPRKTCDCRMLSTGMWIAIMNERLRMYREHGSRPA